MACLEMYNDDHRKGHQYNSCSPMSPRISFSNDFVEIKPENKLRHHLATSEGSSTSSSDFEFCVTNHSMMTADQLFFKGKILPLKKTGQSQSQRTLREELLIEEEGSDDEFSPRPKGKWKGLLGLKRAHIGSKKPEKTNEERFTDSERSSGPVPEGVLVNKTSQGITGEGGSNCRDMEIRV